MTRTAFLLSALIGFTALTTPAIAQDKKEPVAAEKPAAKPAEKKVELRKKTEKVEVQTAKGPTGATKEWIDAENALIDPLNKKDKETILILRNKYSYIKATEIVSRDVGNAVKSCGDKNPDMKSKMDERYKQWRSAVDPILETAEKQLDKDIDALKIVDPDDMRDVLELHDEAYENAEKQIIKTPVTTPDACRGTLASMDRTEDDMIRLLRETLIPESTIRKRATEAKKAKPAAAKKTESTQPAKPVESKAAE